MKYLITYIDDGVQKAFYTNWFDIENNFSPDIGMVVFDLINDKFMCNNQGWNDIQEDHL